MDNMADLSKQKAVAAWMPQEIPTKGDWRFRGLQKVPTQEECDAIWLPFEIYPKSANCHKVKYTINLHHLISG